MASMIKPTSSSSGDDDRYAMMDEKKRKRMVSNRESARRSRMKREQHIKDLNDQIVYFTNKNNEMVMRINEIMQRYEPVESENRILGAQREELRKRLESMEMVSSYLNETNEYSSVNMHQGPSIQPWQLPLQYQPVMTSAGNLYF